MKSICKHLKLLREAKKMGQTLFGTKVGLPQSHISKIETEEIDPRLSTVVNMARVLDQELILVPRGLVSHINALIHGEKEGERRWKPDDET